MVKWFKIYLLQDLILKFLKVLDLKQKIPMGQDALYLVLLLRFYLVENL